MKAKQTDRWEKNFGSRERALVFGTTGFIRSNSRLFFFHHLNTLRLHIIHEAHKNFPSSFSPFWGFCSLFAFILALLFFLKTQRMRNDSESEIKEQSRRRKCYKEKKEGAKKRAGEQNHVSPVCNTISFFRRFHVIPNEWHSRRRVCHTQAGKRAFGIRWNEENFNSISSNALIEYKFHIDDASHTRLSNVLVQCRSHHDRIQLRNEKKEKREENVRV